MAKISLNQFVLCTTGHPRPRQNCPCTCRLPRHSQDVEYKRSTSGALPLAATFKCEFVARTMSLSSCEPLAGAALQEAASGQPGSGRHNNKLIGSRPSVPGLQRMAAFKFKRTRRVHAGGPGAGRNKAVAPNII